MMENPKKDQIVKNIDALMKSNNIKNYSELSRLSGINQPTLHKFIKGEVSEPKYSMLKALSVVLGVTPDVLIETDVASSKRIVSMNGTVPIKGNISGDIYFDDLRYLNWISRDPDAFALQCNDDSLMPRVKNGEFIIIAPNQPYTSGSEIMLTTKDNELLFKTFLFESGNTITTTSLNEDEPPQRLDKTKFKNIQFIAGYAKSSQRVGVIKTYPVNE